jgi:hypothetical protein
MALVACALVAAFSFLVAFAGLHKTPAGQLLGVVGLSMPCLPILLAGGAEPSISIEAWITWLLGFTATTIAVRGVIAWQKRQSRLFHWLALSLLSVAVCIATLGHRYSLPIVTIPMLAMSWYLLWLPPPVKYIKRVGWTLVAGTLATAVWMTIVLSAN